MSKRGAEGPQGSKETEMEFNMSGTPEEKPQRATAAQMANRKNLSLHGGYGGGRRTTEDNGGERRRTGGEWKRVERRSGACFPI
ncbi:hypothetical protein NUU61_008310 [Penicillium alfredii]|uniref:Uncharacterized protein n=1 Tax=Penicillium alfredii TaxID=1506179 RepID=A0A9W9ES56_9EURO|nr:uncharacterized protein NUU61_008310 [Penicillium alfredii]KAJ5087003.1 hypothetical protein NUU61_008310 [Penicillium alfredii]